ncbi:MAG TPA: hypothetical protein VF260_02545 [Bacilli bacterium]
MYQNQNLAAQFQHCEQLMQQVIHQTQAHNNVYQQMMQLEQQNVQKIQHMLQEHQIAVQKLQQAIQICNQLEQSMRSLQYTQFVPQQPQYIQGAQYQ